MTVELIACSSAMRSCCSFSCCMSHCVPGNQQIKKILSRPVLFLCHSIVSLYSSSPSLTFLILIIMDSQEILVYYWSRSSLFSSDFVPITFQYG